VDAPLARAGADWMCLVLTEDAPMTHAGAASIASIVDAPMISAGADFKVRAVNGVLSLCSRCDHTVRGYPLPTPHRQGAGISDSATRPSAVFEDEVVLEEFELTPRACPARPALQTPPPVQPPSRAQPMADPARSRPSPLSLPHAAARSAQDPDTPPPPGLHAPSPLTAADNAATTAAAGSSRA
jgi:hypothetical protein